MGRRVLIPVLAGGGWYLYSNRGVLWAAIIALGVTVAIAASMRRRLIVQARRRIRTLGDLLALSPGAFEEAVADLLRRCGFREVRPFGGPADLGADILCTDRRSRAVVVQCKRHAPGIAVGTAAIQRFMGAISHFEADRGIFVTTSRFSAPAAELAGLHHVELIDGEALAGLALELNDPSPWPRRSVGTAQAALRSGAETPR